ncbi:MAG: FAD binding domain-containing protein, partial [Marinobacter sp.]|nr:FAD binding domain-containing protein [Marinobacter sp.]
AGRRASVQTWNPGTTHDNPADANTQSQGGALSGPAAAAGAAWLQAPDMLAGLKQLQGTSGTLSDAQGARFDAPATLDELREILRQSPEARMVAGGTDLSLEITQQLKDLTHIVGLGGIAELQEIRESDDGIYIGAGATYTSMFHKLEQRWPHYGPMLERLGSLQVRNRGTVGGNVGNASPIGDMPPTLIALGATLELDSAKGTRKMPVQDFFLDYKKTALKAGEFIRGVWIPAPQPDEQLFIYKISKRIDDDISAVLAALWVKRDGDQITDCRLAYGGMAAIPKRAAGAEAQIKGKAWNQTTIFNAISAMEKEFDPMSDVRSSAAYRLQVAGNLLQRAFLESTQDATQTHQPLMVTDYA